MSTHPSGVQHYTPTIPDMEPKMAAQRGGKGKMVKSMAELVAFMFD